MRVKENAEACIAEHHFQNAGNGARLYASAALEQRSEIAFQVSAGSPRYPQQERGVTKRRYLEAMHAQSCTMLLTSAGR